MEFLNLSGSTAKLTGWPLTSLVRLESPWQARHSSFAGFCAAEGTVPISRTERSVPNTTAHFMAAGLLSFAKLANVRHEVGDLSLFQFVRICRHFALAFGDDGGEIGVRHLLDFRRSKIMRSHAL